jgi:tetratricopeptide (TPR) repeat protein
VLSLPAGAALAAPTPPELPRGQVLPKVVCAAQPDRSYALYLPSGYRPDRQWPIVYAFDSRGIKYDREMIELFKAGAERFGVIVASANESSLNVPSEENFRSLGALWTDTHARLSIDDRRAYAFGFSGLVRFATLAAIRSPGTLAGVIGASGGYPLANPPSKEAPFPFFGIIGDKDFNYYEMLDTEDRLDALSIPHRIEIFDGSHEWPPDELVGRAVGWMELQAMRRGTREKEPALVEALWGEDLARARTLEAEGRLWRAWRVYRAAAADFEGLRDTAEAKKQAAGLAATEGLQRDLKERRERDRRDREYLERAPRLFSGVGSEIRPDSVSQFLAGLQVPDLKRRAKSKDPEERLSAERLLYAVYIQTGLYLPRTLMEKKQWDRAILFLQVAAEIDPESPRIPYRLATAYAGKGNLKKALESLERAIEMKGTDRKEIESDPALAPLRQDPESRKRIARLVKPPL